RDRGPRPAGTDAAPLRPPLRAPRRYAARIARTPISTGFAGRDRPRRSVVVRISGSCFLDLRHARIDRCGEREMNADLGAYAHGARHVETPPHSSDELACLVGTDTVPRFLGRAKGAEQNVADELGGHAGAVIDDLHVSQQTL